MENEKIIERLNSLGYVYVEQDQTALEFCIQKITHHIFNVTNLTEIPIELNEIAIDMVCGEFLKLKAGMGLLDGITFERVIKSISEGDTNISFADETTPEQKFYAVIDYLLRGYESDFVRFRKMVW